MDDDIKSIINNLGLISQLGITVVFCLGIGLIAGILTDKLLNQDMLFKIIGIILGLFTGIYQTYRIIMNKIK